MAKNLLFQCWIHQDYIKDRLPRYGKISSTLMRDYAENCGAEYQFYEEPFFHEHSVFSHETHEKLRIIYDETYDDYDTVVYVDTDIIPHSNAKNIFESVKETSSYIESYEKGMIGASVLPVIEEVPTTNARFALDLFEAHNLAPIEIDVPKEAGTKFKKIYKWYNTGVMVWTKEDRIRARNEWQHFYNFKQSAHKKFTQTDEGWFNIQVQKNNFPIKNLDVSWNTTPHFYREINIPSANFYHFSGGKGKDFIENDRKFNEFYEIYCM